jgi:hypothetical protein
MNASESLNKAADLLESEGWTQGTWHDEDGYCAIGAIDEVMTNEWGKTDKEDYALWNSLHQTKLDARRQFRDYVGMGIASWNDNVAQSKEEVVAAMRAAALVAEAKTPEMQTA